MNYDDIIDLPHHVSKNHKPMPMLNRAAQFAPFAALSGYSEAIDECSAYKEPEPTIDPDFPIDVPPSF